MTRRLDKPAAIAVCLALVVVCIATAALAVRGPCHDGDARFLDVTPALPWVGAALAAVAGWRLARTTSWFPRPRRHRMIGVVGSVLLLLVTAFVCLFATSDLVDTLGDPTAGCWSF